MVLVSDYSGNQARWKSWFNKRSSLSDLIFEARDGQTFHCHKLVMAVASPYFQKLFDSGCGRDDGDDGKQSMISAVDLKPKAVEWVLRACYTGDGDLTHDVIVDVMLTSRMYEIDWIAQACVSYMQDHQAPSLAEFSYSRDNEKWQLWTVPQTKWYYIMVAGAKARDGINPFTMGQRACGGRGAIVGGAFQLEKGDVLHILTGSTPTQYKDVRQLGGAGGSFVCLNKKTLLLAAGGGGSINWNSYGSPANLGESGIGSGLKHKGGVGGGNGMTIKSGFQFGGLGWNAGYDALARPSSNVPGQNGGFGGGGHGTGGGGGYSGGSCGCSVGAGGGGSFVSPDALSVWKKVSSSGDGKVSIWEGKEQPTSKSFYKWLDSVTNNDVEEKKPSEAIIAKGWDFWRYLPHMKR